MYICVFRRVHTCVQGVYTDLTRQCLFVLVIWLRMLVEEEGREVLGECGTVVEGGWAEEGGGGEEERGMGK